MGVLKFLLFSFCVSICGIYVVLHFTYTLKIKPLLDTAYSQVHICNNVGFEICQHYGLDDKKKLEKRTQEFFDQLGSNDSSWIQYNDSLVNLFQSKAVQMFIDRHDFAYHAYDTFLKMGDFSPKFINPMGSVRHFLYAIFIVKYFPLSPNSEIIYSSQNNYLGFRIFLPEGKIISSFIYNNKELRAMFGA